MVVTPCQQNTSPMVHIVVMIGPGVIGATAQIPMISDGWIQVEPGVWLVASVLDAQQFRNHFQQLDVEILVARLYGNWGTTPGLAQVAHWLKGADSVF